MGALPTIEKAADPFLNPNLFMPHGHCYLWDPALLWTQVGANLLIGLAYFSIPVALWVFVSRRKDLKDMQVKGLFIMFSLFILFCGTTHFLDILVTWKPYYWIDALIRVITAVLSVLTALVLWPLIPRLLALPSPSQLRMVNQELQAEVARRQASEAEILALNQALEQRVAERTSELIQRTQEAEVANRSKSIFLANMSHELRTPLNAIIGYSELMREDIQDHDQDIARQITDLGHVHASATHLLNLINEVLDVSRIEADKIDIIQAPVQALSLLEDVHRTILPLASKNSNQIEVKAGVPDLVFVSDYYRIKQILLNLLSNACKFTHNGLVQLEMAVSDCHACFRVRDNGIGIQPEHMEQIFDMFYQADSSYGRKYMG
ncbi:MAG TPA: histidine kinase dimerization/phospho-acceptor domain-containing protein, partial [Candidatus Obscuribacterales bacterium]